MSPAFVAKLPTRKAESSSEEDDAAKPLNTVESDSDASSENSSDSSEEQDTLGIHLDLLSCESSTNDLNEITTTPVFTESARLHGLRAAKNKKRHHQPFTQYGLLAGDISTAADKAEPAIPDGKRDPRIFQNIAAPSSTFICGSQGSGKSHTLSCLLENCLIPTDANVLPSPLTGIVFHYDTFTSDSGGSPCEAAHLSSDPDVKVRVLCPPTNITQIRRIYKKLPSVHVEELRINQADLNTKRMLDLMAVSSIQGGGMPLYLHVVSRILRELRIQQQHKGGGFDYRAFKSELLNQSLTDGQMVPLQQRLETLESFMVHGQTAAYGYAPNKKTNTRAKGNAWSPKPGQLTIVDLSCPCVTAEMACSLFNICLSLFLEQTSQVGRVIALDEAHKYMTDSAECSTLTESLLATIRLQRHLAARVIISTQEPTISPRLLDLCSFTVVHRFTSPDWLHSLEKHLAGASSHLLEKATDAQGYEAKSQAAANHEGVHPLSLDRDNISHDILSRIIRLRPGEALLFAPSAIIGVEGPAKGAANGTGHLNGTKSTDSPGSVSAAQPANGVKPPNGTAPTDKAGSTSGSGEAVPLGEPVRLGHGVLKVRIRKRVTADGGRSVLAR